MRAGSAIFPTFYAQPFAAPTDQLAVDIIPSPDRGPFVVTGIQGLPFFTTNLTRSDRVSIRAGGNELQFAPFLASGLIGNAQSRAMNSTLTAPILVPPGSSLFIRNTVEGAAGIVGNADAVLLQGFHTDRAGARVVAQYGQPWVIPVTHDHNATGLTDISTQRQFQEGVLELSSLAVGFMTTPPDIFSVRFRGVELSQAATTFAPVGQTDNPAAAGCGLYATASKADSIIVRSVYTPVTAGQVYKANIWTRRIYQGGNTGC